MTVQPRGLPLAKLLCSLAIAEGLPHEQKVEHSPEDQHEEKGQHQVAGVGLACVAGRVEEQPVCPDVRLMEGHRCEGHPAPPSLKERKAEGADEVGDAPEDAYRSQVTEGHGSWQAREPDRIAYGHRRTAQVAQPQQDRCCAQQDGPLLSWGELLENPHEVAGPAG